jgi:hypothetical protein
LEVLKKLVFLQSFHSGLIDRIIFAESSQLGNYRRPSGL